MDKIIALVSLISNDPYFTQDDWEYLAAGFPACHSEDSTDCTWDARVRGNGEGDSFIAVRGSFGNTLYIGRPGGKLPMIAIESDEIFARDY